MMGVCSNKFFLILFYSLQIVLFQVAESRAKQKTHIEFGDTINGLACAVQKVFIQHEENRKIVTIDVIVKNQASEAKNICLEYFFKGDKDNPSFHLPPNIVIENLQANKWISVNGGMSYQGDQKIFLRPNSSAILTVFMKLSDDASLANLWRVRIAGHLLFSDSWSGPIYSPPFKFDS